MCESSDFVIQDFWLLVTETELELKQKSIEGELYWQNTETAHIIEELWQAALGPWDWKWGFSVSGVSLGISVTLSGFSWLMAT